MKTQTALAIETASPAEFAAATPAEQLAAFCDKLLAKSKIEFEKSVGRYVDRAGNALECAFDGTDKINGVAVDYAHRPALESPWTQQPVPGGSLIAGKRRYDFVNWQVTEGKD